MLNECSSLELEACAISASVEGPTIITSTMVFPAMKNQLTILFTTIGGVLPCFYLCWHGCSILVNRILMGKKPPHTIRFTKADGTAVEFTRSRTHQTKEESHKARSTKAKQRWERMSDEEKQAQLERLRSAKSKRDQ